MVECSEHVFERHDIRLTIDDVEDYNFGRNYYTR